MRKLLGLAAGVLAVAWLSAGPVHATPVEPTHVDASAESPTSSLCSWDLESDPDTVNAAYPDTSANYWSHVYTATPDTELVIHGTYPKARYFSFHVYQPSGVAIDSIYDTEIVPDPGSANPFVGKVAKGKPEQYTVTVLFTAIPADPAPNTLYAGQQDIDDAPNPGGILMFRTYVPDDLSSPEGSVPYPTVTWQTTGGTVLASEAACSTNVPSTGGIVAQELNSQSFPVQVPTSGVSAVPTWTKAGSSPYYGFFGNQQNAYLTSTISRADGYLVVVHAKAPTFPNTTKGQPAYKPSQVRYWSVCENNVDTQVISCDPDYESNERDGSYTYVISDPSTRPTNAIAKDGVAWLPWGSTEPEGVMILRNMVPSPSFPNSIQDISSSETAQEVMGPYYPTAAYCTTSLFESGGWQACFAASGLPTTGG